MFSQIPRAAWLVAVSHLVLEICNNFLPVVYPVFISQLGLTYTQVGIVALVAGVSGTLTQPVFGYLSDRWGARRLSVLSVTWIGLVMGLIGFARDFPTLVILAGLGGLGTAAFHPAGASVVLTRSKSNRRGQAASVFSVSGNIGAALGPLWMATAIAWLGLSGTVSLIPLTLLISAIVYIQLRSAEKIENAANKTPQKQPAPPRHMKMGLMIGLMLIVMAVMARTWFQMTLVTYLPEWIQSQGNSLAYGSQLLAVMLVSVGVGSLTGGTLSDYIGRWQVILISLILIAPIHWLFLMTAGWLQLAMIGVMGILIGASFPVALVMAQDAWPHRVGLATSLVIGLGWTTGGIGASVTGYLADRFSLTTGLQSLALAPLVGVGCILIYALLQRNIARKTAKTSPPEKAPA